MTKAEKSLKKMQMEFYAYVKTHPCLRCGSLGSEANHFEAFTSTKTGLPLKRSHKGYLEPFGCFPLCESCHRTAKDSYHNNERDFFTNMGKSPYWIHQEYARLIVTFFLEREGIYE